MYAIFSFLAYLTLACLVVALWKPRFCPVKNPTRLKSMVFYLTVSLVFFALSCFVDSGDSKLGEFSPTALDDVGDSAVGDGMGVTVLAKEEILIPATGRNRLQVTLGMREKQDEATQKELLSIAAREAVKYHKASGLPVVMVNLVCQKAVNALGERQLAQVVYIPDGKGFDGASTLTSPWETLRAAKRGFSLSELKYLQLWARYYRDYQSPSGVQEKELDSLISAELGVAPGSIHPFANALESLTMVEQ
ncbi:MAG: DUF4875 domain-containing protein [Desulfovibrio sp.]|nr:DUF4875 domain-containing protein [Desulfovibrio sp.]